MDQLLTIYGMKERDLLKSQQLEMRALDPEVCHANQSNTCFWVYVQFRE